MTARHREFICFSVFTCVGKVHRILHHKRRETSGFEIEAIEQTSDVIVAEGCFYLGEGVGVGIKVIEFIGYRHNLRAFYLGQGVGSIQIDMSNVGFGFLQGFIFAGVAADVEGHKSGNGLQRLGRLLPFAGFQGQGLIGLGSLLDLLFAGGVAQQLGIALRFLIGQGLYGQLFAGKLQLIQDGFILLVGDDLLVVGLIFFGRFGCFFFTVFFGRFSCFFVAVFFGRFGCFFVAVFFDGFSCFFVSVFFSRFGCFFVDVFFSGFGCFFVGVFFSRFGCFFVAVFFSGFSCFFVAVFFGGFGCFFVAVFFGGGGCFFVVLFFGQFIFVIILVFVFFSRSFFIICSIVLIGGFLGFLGGVGFGFSGRGGFTLLGIASQTQLGFSFLLS